MAAPWGEVTVRNTGPLPITSWKISFVVPYGLSYVNLWNGAYGAPGTTVTAGNPAWGGHLQPGASVSVTFSIGWHSGTVQPPAVTCTVVS